MTKYVGVLILFSLVTVSQAAEPAWVSVTTELLQREKTGFGGLCGVVVDHSRSTGIAMNAPRSWKIANGTAVAPATIAITQFVYRSIV